MNEPRKLGLVLLIIMAFGLACYVVERLRDAGRGWIALITASVALLIMALLIHGGIAHDADHPELNGWYQSLMRPDAPESPCCGEADAYWCDDYYARDEKAYCRITDDRDDAPLRRPHIPNGTEFEVPTEKLKFSDGNPTGHAVLFVTASGYVWCFVQNGGV